MQQLGLFVSILIVCSCCSFITSRPLVKLLLAGGESRSGESGNELLLIFDIFSGILLHEDCDVRRQRHSKIIIDPITSSLIIQKYYGDMLPR